MSQLMLPKHYSPTQVVDADRWLDYPGLMTAAIDWRKAHGLAALPSR